MGLIVAGHNRQNGSKPLCQLEIGQNRKKDRAGFGVGLFGRWHSQAFSRGKPLAYEWMHAANERIRTANVPKWRRFSAVEEIKPSPNHGRGMRFVPIPVGK